MEAITISRGAGLPRRYTHRVRSDDNIVITQCRDHDMTTVIPSVSSSDTTSHVPSGDPPTSRAVPIARNPFARPKPPSSNSFTRTTLLPTHSPQRAVLAPASRFDANGSTTSIAVNGFETPAEKSVAAPGTTSASRDKRQGWRLLWRGGLEIGKEGWRLDGTITTLSSRLGKCRPLINRHHILRSPQLPLDPFSNYHKPL